MHSANRKSDILETMVPLYDAVRTFFQGQGGSGNAVTGPRFPDRPWCTR